MPSTNLRERLDGMIWEAADITTYFRFDGASFLAPVSVMGCTPSNCCSEGSKKGSKGVSALRFSAVTNSFNINANVKAKTVEMTEATEISRKSESPWKFIIYTDWLIHISTRKINHCHTQGPLL